MVNGSFKTTFMLWSPKITRIPVAVTAFCVIFLKSAALLGAFRESSSGFKCLLCRGVKEKLPIWYMTKADARRSPPAAKPNRAALFKAIYFTLLCFTKCPFTCDCDVSFWIQILFLLCLKPLNVFKYERSEYDITGQSLRGLGFFVRPVINGYYALLQLILKQFLFQDEEFLQEVIVKLYHQTQHTPSICLV